MQTFVPFEDSQQTASILTNADLSQVIEAAIVLIEESHRDGPPTIVSQHPLYKMWDGYGFALCAYGLTMVEEVRRRGTELVAGVFENAEKVLSDQLENAVSGDYNLSYPSWWSNRDLHRAHQSELLRSNPAHYEQYFPNVPLTLPQFWVYA